MAIGTNQMEGFEKSWPEGFYASLLKEVFTIPSKKKQVKVGNKGVSDTEATYALYICLLISHREFDFSEVLEFELEYYPLVHFDENR